MNRKITPIYFDTKMPCGNTVFATKVYRWNLENARVFENTFAFCFNDTADQVVLVNLDIPEIDDAKSYDELCINVTAYDGKIVHINRASMIQLRHALMHLKHDADFDTEASLRFRAAELLIEADGHLNTKNLKYLDHHNIRWEFGEVDTFGVLSIELEWADIDGHLHKLWIG